MSLLRKMRTQRNTTFQTREKTWIKERKNVEIKELNHQILTTGAKVTQAGTVAQNRGTPVIKGVRGKVMMGVSILVVTVRDPTITPAEREREDPPVVIATRIVIKREDAPVIMSTRGILVAIMVREDRPLRRITIEKERDITPGHIGTQSDTITIQIVTTLRPLTHITGITIVTRHILHTTHTLTVITPMEQILNIDL